MNFPKLQSFLRALLPGAFTPTFLLIFCPSAALAQREYTVVKPRERSAFENVTIKTKAAQPTKGVLAVVLDPMINGQVIVKDASGRILAQQEADKDGQAEFQLQRKRTYQVEASFPGYRSKSGTSRPLMASEIIRLQLVPEYARLVLNGLPAGAQVMIDDQPRGTADPNGVVTVNDLKPGDHSLLIRHPEYNDYADSLKGIDAGETANWRISLARVAKLTVRAPAGATVLIDGAVQGKINADGTVRIDYAIDRASERTIAVELLGYQPAAQKLLLTPGPRTLEFKLDPVVTSAGVTDFFNTLSLWNAPATWKLVINNDQDKKLQVEGPELGTLKDKIYRDIQEGSNFTIWLDDGKGATWAVRADKEGRNYYLFHLAGPKSTTHTPRRFYTYVVRDGGAPVEVSTPIPFSMNLDQKISYTITFAVTGYTIQHWITSNQTGEKFELGIWTDTTPSKDQFLFGTFGFRSLDGEVFTVDDFILEPAKDSQRTP